MKLSIIIPVYNAEKYLQKCLQSVCDQDLPAEDYEVLFIDDGSSDNSVKVAEPFKIKIPNLKIVSQKNQGEAAARNVALQLAKGEFITFLDNDDFYGGKTLGEALKIMENNDLEILYLKINRVDEAGRFLSAFADMATSGKILPGLLHERRPLPATVYKKSAVRSSTFPLCILVGTDSVFNAIVQSRTSRVSYTESLVYCYTEREGNLSKKGSTGKAFVGYLNAIEILSDFKNKNFIDNNLDVKKYFENMITVFMTRAVELSILPSFDRNKYKQLKTVLTRENYLYILSRFSPKYPYIDRSFQLFKTYQLYLKFKSKIYNLLYRA